jgi:hypothetical protein
MNECTATNSSMCIFIAFFLSLFSTIFQDEKRLINKIFVDDVELIAISFCFYFRFRYKNIQTAPLYCNLYLMKMAINKII